MQIVGRVTKNDMAAIQKRGIAPQKAVDLLLAEAKRRHPDKTIIFRQADDHDGLNVIAF